ncbi:MAG: hypothetical protein JW747_02935 [Candidatus Aminicenantes bacterium]|nr:hypothetical protein [Candidatus Aminicenantes bacterium]
MFILIVKELRNHAPFTVFGALTGILLMVFCQRLPKELSYRIFYILHPLHVVLSAMVTASIYGIHECDCLSKRCLLGRCNLWKLLLIGYAGSVGIATLSDSVIPFLGETLLGLPNRGIHIGFIEKWWLVNPLAVAGVAFALLRPGTKFPHAGHVLFSTWASLFHILIAVGGALSGWSYAIIFLFLFISVWLPCCLSDIVFPLLFVKRRPARVPSP